MTGLRTAARAAFVDSSAFYASFVRRDRYHSEAQAIMARCQREQIRLITSNFIEAETHALLLNRSGYAAGRDFLREMARGNIRVSRSEPEDELAAKEIIFRYSDKLFSMVDAISFAMMHRFGIDQAFAFDRNFTQFGLRLLQP